MEIDGLYLVARGHNLERHLQTSKEKKKLTNVDVGNMSQKQRILDCIPGILGLIMKFRERHAHLKKAVKVNGWRTAEYCDCRFFYGGVHASYRVPWLTTVPRVTNITANFLLSLFVSSPFEGGGGGGLIETGALINLEETMV